MSRKLESVEVSLSYIDNIHKLSRKFIEENRTDELIFFDDFWEIYESHLKTQIRKPLRKWKYKFPKLSKEIKFLGMSESATSINLITPAIIEIITAAYIHISKIREKLSLERIEETIKKCGKKLPVDIIQQTISFFAPLMLEDLKKAEGIPVEEIEKKPEINSHLEEDESRAFAEKKEYMMYSHEYVDGKHLTEKEYKEYSAKIEQEKGDYCFIIDEGRNQFYYKGNLIKKNLPAKSRIALKFLLVRKRGYVANYKDIYEYTLKTEPGEYFRSDKQTVHRWISDLRDGIGDELNWFLKKISGIGYEVAECKDLKFFIFERLPR